MNGFLLISFALLVYMSIWFVVSVLRKRNDVADQAWGLGFVLVAWFGFWLAEDHNTRAVLVNLLVSLWGLRLFWHISQRNKSKPEDSRYMAWREQWGKWFFARSYLQIFMLQGVLLYLISLPVLLINLNTSKNLGLIFWLGLLVWLGGFLFESISDKQLARFIAFPTNKGKIMQSGLWRYSRHPNYFGEVTQWWGIWLIALEVSWGWIGIIGPLTITTLILKISGIPLLEKKMSGRPEFEAYKKTTSQFIPLPPKLNKP